ncbi:MAG TPA: HD domain-containing phosphohydrolase [Gemmatimonadales bacterium]|jgi:HD-GYP domain-containing protein (c-di-GMP phosphodiesterase class II)|nr:HD domain-containing phosphohydrolase [Gemmatimonadales bacterium]
MTYILLHPAGWDPTPVRPALDAEGVVVRAIAPGAPITLDDHPTVLVLDPAARTAWAPGLLEALADAGAGILAIGAPGEADLPAELPATALAGFVKAPAGPRETLLALRAAFKTAAVRREVARARGDGAARADELGELTEIGIRLSTERDYNRLLETILTQARRITQSDAGSLYLVEQDEQGRRRLRFKLSQNHSRPDIPFVEFTIPIDHASIAGYAAAEGEPLVIDDVYTLPPDVEYSFNRSFDQRYGYRTRSMLSIPMLNHHNETIGVLQLINRKRRAETVLHAPEDAEREVLAYSPHTVKLVKALAGQAGVSVENSQLYEAIERLFEGFVKAAVTAIEQRDPTTSGHSLRVATMSVELATSVDRVQDGPFRAVTFSPEQIRELRYAGLLHDFGKVGVREQVLVKAKKLYAADLALIRQRHAFLQRTAQWRFEQQRADHLERHGREGYDEHLRRIRAEFEAESAALDRFIGLVLESNEPTVLPEGNFERLQEFAERTYESIEGAVLPYLTDDEVRFLSIRKGSLDEAERLEIESHVTHTYWFLRKIPWTRELQGVPDIAHGHHEKLDGSGYPRRIKGEAIPIQTRMMTIADIFDALTASDRPYKRALPLERALNIMADEVKAGMLDPALYQVFVDAKVYERKEG